jgi:HK97 family phage major capsid protein
MDKTQIAALREEFAQNHKDAGDILTKAATEKRELSAEEKDKNKQRFTRMDAIKAQVEEAERLAAYNFAAGTADTGKDPKGRAEFEAEKDGQIKFEVDAYKNSVNQFARSGVMDRQLYTTTSATASSAFLPKSVLPPVTVRRLNNAFRDLLNYYGMPTITRTLTEQISLPVEDDTANTGQQQSESATSGTQLDADATGSITLNPILYSSKQLWWSNSTVNAVDFDLFSYSLPLLSKRVDKAEESAWTTKVLANATVGKTTAVNSGMTYLELIAWEHSLNAAYRSDMGFILADSLYQIVRQLVDTNNRPIMDLDPTNKFQATIHGKPVFVSDYLAPVATITKSGIIASAEAIKILDAGMQRLTRYVLVPAQPDQTGFELFANADLDFVRKGVRVLQQAV